MTKAAAVMARYDCATNTGPNRAVSPVAAAASAVSAHPVVAAATSPTPAPTTANTAAA